MHQHPRKEEHAESGVLQRRRVPPASLRAANTITHTANAALANDRDVHLSQRDDETRVDRQQQHEIHFARAHQFRGVGAVEKEERLVDFLDEIARAGEQHHLPDRPGAYGFCLGKNDAHETQLQSGTRPVQRRSRKKIALERQLARDGSPPQRAVNRQITPQVHSFRKDNYPGNNNQLSTTDGHR